MGKLLASNGANGIHTGVRGRTREIITGHGGRLSPGTRAIITTLAGDYHHPWREIITGARTSICRFLAISLKVAKAGDYHRDRAEMGPALSVTKGGRLSPVGPPIAIFRKREIITGTVPPLTREKGGRLSPIRVVLCGNRRREIITGRTVFRPGGQSGRLSPVRPLLTLRVPGPFSLSVTRHEKSID